VVMQHKEQPAESSDKTMCEFVQGVYSAMQRRELWSSALYLFIFGATPSMGAASFYFYTNRLKISSDTLTAVGAFSSAASLAGIWCYNRYLKLVPIRPYMGAGTVLTTLIASTSLLLYTGKNRDLGLGDSFFLIGDSVLMAAAGQIMMMPLLTLAAQLCPRNIEGTMFSCFTAIFNLGMFVGQQSGAALTSLMGVDDHNFDNITLLCIICLVCNLLVLPALVLLPSADDMASVTKTQAQRVAEYGGDLGDGEL